MKHYALVGRGGANKRVILASLNDLPKDAHFHVLWTGDEPTAGQEVVIDWLIDNEKMFTVYGKNVPRGIARYAEDILDEPMDSHVHRLGCQTALVLWEDGMDDTIIRASAVFPQMLELTNGLAPIEVDVSDEDEQEPVSIPHDEEEREFFTREELENMPAAAVKRQAKEKGLDITGKVKSQIIDMLLGHEVEEPQKILTDVMPLPETDMSNLATEAERLMAQIQAQSVIVTELLKQHQEVINKMLAGGAFH